MTRRLWRPLGEARQRKTRCSLSHQGTVRGVDERPTTDANRETNNPVADKLFGVESSRCEKVREGVKPRGPAREVPDGRFRDPGCPGWNSAVGGCLDEPTSRVEWFEGARWPAAKTEFEEREIFLRCWVGIRGAVVRTKNALSSLGEDTLGASNLTKGSF